MYSIKVKMPKTGLAHLPLRKAAFIEPMDCAPVTKLADGPGWLYEIKLDGYRAVAIKSERGVNLFSRRLSAKHSSILAVWPCVQIA